MPERPRIRCDAKTKKGAQCKSWAVQGLTKCRMHCGMSGAKAKAKGAQNLALRVVGKELARLRESEPEQVDIGRSFEALIYSEVIEERFFASLVEELGEDEGIYGPDHAGDQRLHVLVQKLAEVRDRLAKHLKMAHDAGINERRTQIMEEQGVAIAQVMILVIDDPDNGLTPAQRQKLKRSGARHLRALPRGA